MSRNADITLSAREVLRSPSVATYLSANFLLNCGSLMQAAALGKHVYDITGRELSIGWLGLAEFVPSVLLVLVTGVVADRFSRKHVGAIGIAGDALCSVVLVWVALSEPAGAGAMYSLAFLYGVFRAFANPAIRSIPAMIAPAGGLPRLVAMNSTTWQVAAIVGPAASGFLYAVDPAVPYAVAGVFLLAGVVLLLVLKVPRHRVDDAGVGRTRFTHAIEGLSFIRRTPVLFAAISLDLFAVLFGGAIALLPVIAEERLGAGAVGFGWLRAGVGIGAATMAIALAFRPVRRRVGRTLLVVVAVFGGATIVLGLTEVYAVAMAAVIVASAADMVSVFIRGSIGPLVTPDNKLGRVSAAEGVFIGASNELGAFESGVVANAVGVTGTVVGGGVATIAIAAAWWKMFPSLREIDRFEDLSPGE